MWIKCNYPSMVHMGLILDGIFTVGCFNCAIQFWKPTLIKRGQLLHTYTDTYMYTHLYIMYIYIYYIFHKITSFDIDWIICHIVWPLLMLKWFSGLFLHTICNRHTMECVNLLHILPPEKVNAKWHPLEKK